eukprot:6463543-Prymnesium_polylepis.1
MRARHERGSTTNARAPSCVSLCVEPVCARRCAYGAQAISHVDSVRATGHSDAGALAPHGSRIGSWPARRSPFHGRSRWRRHPSVPPSE